MAASSSTSEVVHALIKVADLEGLQSFTPDHYDWSQCLGPRQRPPLVLVLKPLCRRDTAENALKMIEWMVQSGASPLQKMGPEAKALELKKGEHQFDNISVACAGQSALTFACAALEAMTEVPFYVDWSLCIQHLRQAVAIMTKGTAMSRKTNLLVPQGVVDTWESVQNMTSTHNVVFETADDEVSAHDLILVAASPVLKAMLQSTMKEGSSKRIPVKDSSGSGVRLLVDMLYTSSTRDDPDYKTVLVALDLAHRWQVDSIVPVLEGILTGMVTVKSFVAITEAAILKGLELLQRACRTFGTSNSKVKTMVKKRTLPAAVLKLLGESAAEAPSPDHGERKKRRTFAAC
ncbi:KLHL2 [Symbiodinium sp. CCMP2592]|nr:KLHL2 [Symbiodinium sp. CCMP2592]